MKKRILQILLVGIMLLALVVSSLASCNKDDGPNGTPGTTEGAGEDSTDDIKLSAPDNGGSAGLEYKKAVRIDLSEKEVTLVFTNTERSTHNVTVQVVAEGTVLAESGMIAPGEKISKLAMKDGASIAEGIYADSAKLVVRYYDPETNACSAVNSEFNVTVTVVA